jgi:DNA-binding transcriptional MerR regulator/effector-binding domain-containing protein
MVETAGMDPSLSIGELSRLTHLSVKTLRHYHQVGVLVPVAVDPATGYRRYSTDQVAPAHLARRLRALDMPLPEVRVVLETEDESARTRAILDYLTRMERDLDRTRAAVGSLRALLEGGTPPPIEHRDVAALVALTRRATVAPAAVAAWCAETYPLLHAALAAQGLEPSGPDGALYDRPFFEQSLGTVVAFVPTATAPAPAGDLVPGEVPAARLAVAVHVGAFEELDRTYGVLGTAVASAGLEAPGPIRERYLISPAESTDPGDWRTEVCWPIAR